MFLEGITYCSAILLTDLPGFLSLPTTSCLNALE